MRQKAKLQAQARVVVDRGNHHALEVRREGLHVHFIPVPDVGPVAMSMELSPVFDKRFETLKGFPVEKAARFFIGVAQDRGGTYEALDALASLVTITAQERQTAMNVVSQAANKAGKKPAKPAKKHQAKGNGSNGHKPEKKDKQPTAAERFRELIMKGGKTDDQIFAQVQKEFKLDDAKRSYVAWYRNDLKKKGQHPPAAKEA